MVRLRPPLRRCESPVGLSCRAVTVEGATGPLIESVDVDVRPGGWCSVVGPNGAGKTTLVRAILGLVPYRGRVLAGGLDLRHLRAFERARIVALVPQHPVVPPGMAVADYVTLGRTAGLSLFQSESRRDHEVVRSVLDALDLATYATRLVSSLSGGERQRAVIARALAQEASLLVLDEPTTGLDLSYQQEVLDLIDNLRAERGLTIMSTLHDLTLAGAYAEELVLLAGGRVVASGPVSTTLTEENVALITRARFRIVREGGTTVVVPLRTP